MAAAVDHLVAWGRDGKAPPNAPPELTAALDTLDQLVADHIASARLPTAA